MDDPIRRLPSNAFYNAVAVFLPVVLAIATTPFILSRLGNEAFGLYLVALSVAGFAGLLDLGFGTASIKFVSEYRARGDGQALSDLVNTLLLARLPQAVIVVGLGYFGAPFVCRRVLMVPPAQLEEAVFVVRISILTLSIALFGGSMAALPRALHRYDVASRISTVHGLALTVTTVVVLALGYGLSAIVLAEFGLGILSLTVSAIVARRLLPEWRPALRYSPQSLKRLLHFGGLTTLNALAGFVFLHVNRILIGRSLGIATIPFFAIPWSLSSRATQLTTALTEAVAPAASALAAGPGGGRLRFLYERGIVLTGIVGASLLVPLGVGARDLLTLWLGSEFAERSCLVLRVLALSAFVQALGAAPYFILTGLGRPAAANLPPLVAALLNFALAVVMLPSHGLPGLALALLLGTSAQTLLLVYSAESTLGLRGAAVRIIAKPVVAALLAVATSVALASLLQDPLVRLTVATAAAAFVQHLMLVLFGCYGPRELRMIHDALAGPTSARSISGNA